MANPIGQSDEVVGATDKLMKALLAKAEADPDNVDFALQCVQAATRWTAVKNRMNVPDEGNAFDGWRTTIADSSGLGGSRDPAAAGGGAAPGAERAASGPKKGSRSGTIGASRLPAANGGGRPTSLPPIPS